MFPFILAWRNIETVVGRGRMVVGFKTTYAINAYHHYCSEFQSRSRDMYSAQNDVIKFVSDLRQIDGILHQ
jgi:hypothetical protein